MIYVASSWKNDEQLNVVHRAIQCRGVQTLDFRSQGRWWSADDNRDEHYGRIYTQNGIAAFNFDKALMERATGAFILLPAGMATALEAGWFAGRGIPTVVCGIPHEPLDITWLLVAESPGVLALRSSIDFAVVALLNLMIHGRQSPSLVYTKEQLRKSSDVG